MDYNTHKFKNSMYIQLARIGKALSSPKRLEIIDFLTRGSQTVESIAKETGMSTANTSRHLQTLLMARVVNFEKKGVYSYYHLSDKTVADMLLSMQLLGEKLLTEMQTLIHDVYGQKDDIESVNTEHLINRMRNDKVTLIDVRPKAEYERKHIPGAISIPLDELEENLAALPQDQEIIAYCRGRYCILSVEATNILKSHGYKAARMQDQNIIWESEDEAES